MNTFKLVETEKTACFSFTKTQIRKNISKKSTNKLPRHQGLPPIAPEPLPSAPPQATTESKRSAGGFDDWRLGGRVLDDVIVAKLHENLGVFKKVFYV